ncbi:MAG TPA: hypothetical protein VF625_11425, partial [Longimicrobium sp.]
PSLVASGARGLRGGATGWSLGGSTARRTGAGTVTKPGTEDETIRFGDLSTTGGVVNVFAAFRMAEQMTAAR